MCREKSRIVMPSLVSGARALAIFFTLLFLIGTLIVDVANGSVRNVLGSDPRNANTFYRIGKSIEFIG